MGFLTPLDLRAYKPGEWVLLHSLIYRAEAGRRFTVPRGFITDLASIPRPLRGLLNQNGKSRRPAVLHDFLYCVQSMTRAQADALFLEALKAAKVNAAVRYVMWAGVRAGGWAYWSKRAGGISRDDFVSPDYFGGKHGERD